ncbi:hypothetical protein MFLAVUS_010812 [Mucor flavus]|uniref:Uncharacterized protein n=1 Tax=Mucor flavus TaxID=439312 RepID=A0ABP9ZE06_9FUNG
MSNRPVIINDDSDSNEIDNDSSYIEDESRASEAPTKEHETDFVKVQREMKAIIDQQIDLGVNNPVCYDLLVEGKHSLQHKFCQKAHCELLGYDCYLYQMSLKYEAEYRSRLIA